VRERIERLDQFIPATEFFFSTDVDYKAVAGEMIPKGRAAKELAKLLGELSDEYDAHRGAFTAAALEPMTRAFTEARGWKTKELFMVLRIVVTGRTASPPLFETMEILGKEVVRRRLRNAIDFVGTIKA